MRSVLAGAAIAMVAALMCGPVSAAISPADVADPPPAGQFVWDPDGAPSGPIRIVVSLPTQTAYVLQGGALIGVSSVSSGRPGHDTPTGVFNVLEKDPDHHSSLYDDAPMPFMQRLTWDGVALHAGKVPNHPASHGCIRLPLEFARALYGVTRVGARVEVTDEYVEPDQLVSTAESSGYTSVAASR